MESLNTIVKIIMEYGKKGKKRSIRKLKWEKD